MRHTAPRSQLSASAEFLQEGLSPQPFAPCGVLIQPLDQTARPQSKRAVVKVDRVLRCGARSPPPPQPVSSKRSRSAIADVPHPQVRARDAGEPTADDVQTAKTSRNSAVRV